MRPCRWCSRSRQRCFNPRICKRCDPVLTLYRCRYYCFNPRICKRCDYRVSVKRVSTDVSIHASVKDATLPISRVVVPRLVSIHASVKDATLNREGYRTRRQVSIHASVKDATCSTWVFCASVRRFNPRICKRCDNLNLIKVSLCSCFNPRICKRCDTSRPDNFIALSVSIHASVKDATRIIYSTSPTPVVSIHASVKDATYNNPSAVMKRLFQSTHL